MDESFGRYRLLERLGQGGMAEVFKAKSFGVEGFEKILVIKRILPELAASKSFVDLFVHEAKLAVRLSHANIVQVFDLGKVDEGGSPQYFIAMEYVAGVDFSTLLRWGKERRASFPVGMPAYIASEVAKGLEHAHRRRDEQMRPLGIVHWDISPQNVLLSWEGEVKVTDFGIAKARTSLDPRSEDEPSGIVLQGKYAYMSPEQASGREVNAKSDVFSLGALLYQSISGVHPFSTSSAEETLRRVRAAEYPPLELVRSDVPDQLVRLVRRALAKDPDERPDAGQMHEELLAFLYASGERFGPNELSELLAEFRAPSPNVVVELGVETGEDTRPHPVETPAPLPAPEPEPAKKFEPPRAPLDRAVEVPRVAEPKARQGRFVGRKKELQKLGEVFALATRKRVQVVTLRGERGIGKSRFLHEVARRLRRGNLDVAFYVVACPKESASHSLSGLTAMLRTLAGIPEGEGLASVEPLEPRLRALGLRDEEVGAVLSQLGAKGGEATTVLLRSAFAQMASKLSEDQLHIFAWDDADALDPESIAVLDGALQRMSGARAVFILSGPKHLQHALERLSAHHAMSLGPLGEAEAEQLIAARAETRTVPAELLRFCEARAKGHPLFLEEIVRELLDSKALVIEHGGIVEMRLERANVPDSLEDLLTARIRALPEKDRALLDAAAILGDFWGVETLAELVGASPREVQSKHELLETRRFVRQKAGGRYSFFSPLIREVLLGLLKDARRQALHARAARIREATLDTDAPEEAERIARHFEEAGEADRAAGFFARSGIARAGAGQWEGAARDLSRALSQCDPSRRSAGELSSWIEELAEAVYRVRSADNLAEIAERLLRRIDDSASLPVRINARLDIARALGAMHSFDEADVHLEAARHLARPDDALSRRALTIEGEISMRRGDFRKALSCFEEGAKRIDSADPAEAMRILAGLAQSLAAKGEREEALRAMDRADLLLQVGDFAGACENAKLRAVVHFSSGDFAEAARESERALRLARDLGLGYEVAINLHNLGDALLRIGDHPRAYASFQQSSAIFDELGQERMLVQNRGYLAYLDSMHGAEGASMTLRDSIGYASAHGYSWDEVNGRYLLALLYEKSGKLGLAKRELERTRELAEAIGLRLIVRDCDAGLDRLAQAGMA